MKKILYAVISLVFGIFIHIVFDRYLSLFGVAPQILLLFVVAHGFLLGPLSAELMGFFWGLMLDAMGVSLFGLNTFLFTFAGYMSGKLRRRVASERPSTQLVIGLVSSVYYFGSITAVRAALDISKSAFSWWQAILGSGFNAFLVIATFWLIEWWINAWGLNQEHL